MILMILFVFYINIYMQISNTIKETIRVCVRSVISFVSSPLNFN